MALDYNQVFINENLEEAMTKYFEGQNCDTFDKLAEMVDVTKRNIYIGEITPELGAAVESLIRFYNSVDKSLNIPCEKRVPIKLWVDSEGGDLISALTIMDAIELSSTPIYTINQGMAYSGGFFIFMCGHRRITFPRSSFLFHEGSISTGGDANKFENMADFYKKQRTQLKADVISHTKITEELYNEHAKDDWWLTAEEAIELGIADEILTKEFYG